MTKSFDRTLEMEYFEKRVERMIQDPGDSLLVKGLENVDFDNIGPGLLAAMISDYLIGYSRYLDTITSSSGAYDLMKASQRKAHDERPFLSERYRRIKELSHFLQEVADKNSSSYISDENLRNSLLNHYARTHIPTVFSAEVLALVSLQEAMHRD